MGDRGNVVLNYGDDKKIYLYTHWNRYNLGSTLQAALERGRNRWGDDDYLARIIFSEMIQHEVLDETGYGLGVEIGDGDETAEVFLREGTIRFKDQEPVVFDHFVRLDNVDEIGEDD